MFPFILNEPLYIIEGVAEKQTDLVRKFHVRRYSHAEILQTIFEMIRFVAIV